MERRSDQLSAMLLDVAVNASRRYGTLPPISELGRLGVPLETAVRVLTQPESRRQCAEVSDSIRPLDNFT